MTDSLITHWDKDKRAAFRKTPMVWNHTLHKLPLFDDAALAELIDKHPRDLADFCTMDDGADNMASWKGGDPGTHSGAELLAAVRTGKLWINLRETFNIHAPYSAALNAVMAELKHHNPGFNPVSVRGGLLISSPAASVPFHIDRTDVLLWHLRGHKRVWVYPLDEEVLPEVEVEEILLHAHNDDVPYKASFEDKATIYDLEPGMAATWPLHAPHRVVNQGDLNVSITVEYAPFSTIVQNGAMITNGIMRRRLGLDPQIEKQGRINRLMRFAASRVLRKMDLVKAKAASKSGYLFTIDPEAKNAVSGI